MKKLKHSKNIYFIAFNYQLNNYKKNMTQNILYKKIKKK